MTAFAVNLFHPTSRTLAVNKTYVDLENKVYFQTNLMKYVLINLYLFLW